MNKAVIWDLDGTLFDSYDVIVDSIYLAFQEYGIIRDMQQIHEFAIAFSIKELFAEASAEYGISAQGLHTAYSRISQSKYLQIKPMAGALDVLEQLKRAGVTQFVFTHRGATTAPVLENLKMTGYFREVVTSQNKFARKPDPEGLTYLMEKYSLNKENTWYVGDRRLDMECAANAGISGILFQPPGAIDVSGGSESHVVSKLEDILKIIME